MANAVAVMTDNGELTVPKIIRDYLGMSTKCSVIFTQDESGRIYMQKEKASSKKVFEKYKNKIDIDKDSIAELREKSKI